MSRQRKNTSKNFFESQRIKLYGGETTSHFRQRDALLYGESRKFQNDSRCQCASMLGQVSTVTRKCSNIHHSEAKKNDSIQRKSPWRFTDGYSRTMRNRATNYSIRTSEARRRLSRSKSAASTMSASRSTRTIIRKRRNGSKKTARR